MTESLLCAVSQENVIKLILNIKNFSSLLLAEFLMMFSYYSRNILGEKLKKFNKIIQSQYHWTYLKMYGLFLTFSGFVWFAKSLSVLCIDKRFVMFIQSNISSRLLWQLRSAAGLWGGESQTSTSTTSTTLSACCSVGFSILWLCDRIFFKPAFCLYFN